MAQHINDARLATVGDMTIAGGTYALVIRVDFHQSPPDGAPMRKGEPCVEVVTENGSRWFGLEYYKSATQQGE